MDVFEDLFLDYTLFELLSYVLIISELPIKDGVTLTSQLRYLFTAFHDC